MDIVGYAVIKDPSPSLISVDNKSFYSSMYVRVLEFNEEGSALILNQDGSAIGTIDKEDIKTSFRCYSDDTYIYPPELNSVERMLHSMKVITRKGGYSPILKQMIILQSLHKGEFTDSVLWSKQ